MNQCSEQMGALLPFAWMVVAILAQVGNLIVTKNALSQGINKYAIIVYSDALAALLLLPCSLIAYRSNRPPLTFSLLCDFFLLAVFGSSAQIFGYVGLQYSSPTLGTAMINLIPAFTFVLAVLFRLEKLDLRSKSSLAKSIGTIVSIAGAFVVTFYKGPPIFSTPPHQLKSHQLFSSSQLLWIIGAFFLAAESFMNSSFYILQTFVLKKFPAVLTVICYLCFFNTILTGIFASIVVEDASAWTLKLNVGLVAILYTAIIGVAFRISLIAWCLSKTGPLYVSMFKPLAIVFAVFMDAIFLGDTPSLGSLIGGIIIVTGFYALMWGKAKEEKMVKNDNSGIGSAESGREKVPLLQNIIEEI